MSNIIFKCIGCTAPFWKHETSDESICPVCRKRIADARAKTNVPPKAA